MLAGRAGEVSHDPEALDDTALTGTHRDTLRSDRDTGAAALRRGSSIKYLYKKEGKLAVDSFLEPTFAAMELFTFLLN